MRRFPLVRSAETLLSSRVKVNILSCAKLFFFFYRNRFDFLTQKLELEIRIAAGDVIVKEDFTIQIFPESKTEFPVVKVVWFAGSKFDLKIDLFARVCPIPVLCAFRNQCHSTDKRVFLER